MLQSSFSPPFFQKRFRKLASSAEYVWAIGEDFKPYVFVCAAVIPARVTEESFENQVKILIKYCNYCIYIQY